MSKAEQARAALGGDFERARSQGAQRQILQEKPAHAVGVQKSGNVMAIEVDRIQPDPDQPRKEFDQDAIERLGQSLKTRGQLQPIRVRWHEDLGSYVVLMGERRWRASRAAGLPTLECIVHSSPLDASQKLQYQLIENCLREDLKPIEQALAYRSLMETNGWNRTQVAAELAVSGTAVTKALSLLELPESVQQDVAEGKISPTIGYEITKLPLVEDQLEVAQVVIEQGLNRAEATQVISERRHSKPKSRPKAVGDKRTIPVTGGRVEVVFGEEDQSSAVVAGMLEEALKTIRREIKRGAA